MRSNSRKKINPHTASLILLFSLTTNDREVLDQLKPLLQQSNLQFTRFTTKIQKDFVGVFSSFATNASWVAWTHDAISPYQLAFLSQALISKVILSASFYNGQMWTVSRFQKMAGNLLPQALSPAKKTFQLSFQQGWAEGRTSLKKK